MSCDLFFFFFSNAKSSGFQNKLYQIKDLMKFAREKCSFLIHQYKHSTVVHNNEHEEIMGDSFVNLMDIFHRHMINFVVHKLFTLPFILEDFLTAAEEPYPWPKKCRFCGYHAAIKVIFFLFI